MTGSKKKSTHKRLDEMTEMMEHIRDLFESDEAQLNGSGSQLLHDARKEAFKAFEKQGMPTRKHEEYKFTDLSRVYRKFDGIAPSQPAEVTPSGVEIEGMEANVIVLVNGYYRPDLSAIKDGSLRVSGLAEALRDNDTARKYYGCCAKVDADAFLALNTAFSRLGLFIHLPANTKLDHPVIIHYHNDASHRSVTYTRNLVVAEGGAEATIIEKTGSNGQEDFLMNMAAEVYVPSNANIEWFKLQNDGANAHFIDQLMVHQERDSNFSATTITLNGNTIRNNVYLALDGENCESHLYGLYAIDGTTHVDHHTAVDHLKPHSFSNELYKGILDDKAGGVFNGKVFVRQDAQKTNAFQSNKNILLSDQATVNTKPQLEIWADDVKCSHGCTTGQIDQEALFYLRTRGLSEKSARALMLYAFALETVEHVENEPLRSYLEELIGNKLNYRFS